MSDKLKPAPKALQQENARLRAQLSEAQQLIEALKRGEVNTPMAAGSGNEEPMPLGDAEKVYRQLVEQMGEDAPHPTLITADEQLARAILEQVTDAIVVCDKGGWIIRASRAAQQLCACQPTGSRFEHAFALQDDGGTAVTLQQFLDTPDPQGTECWFTRDNSRHQLRVSTARLNGPDETSLGIVVTLNDVTQIKTAERQALDAKNELQTLLEQSNRTRLALLSVIEDQKETEQALRESEAHFRLALGSLPISVWNMDTELRYIWVYDHEQGKDPATILGKTDAELYNRDDAIFITHIKQQVLDSGKPLGREIYATAGERLQYFNYFLEPLRNESGEVVGLTGASVNVTSTRELEESRKNLSDALKQSGSAIAMLDSDINVEFVNQTFTDLFGYTQNELSGQPVTVIAPPENTPTLQPAKIRELISKKNIFRGEVIRQSKRGELITTYLTAAPLKNTDGELTGFVATYNDLRAIKASEKRTREALIDTITAISLTIEKRDPYTAGHQQRVAELAVAIAREIALDELQIEGIYFGSLIHDIGKIYIPFEILNRPGKLSSYEFGLITSHPEVGYEIIKDVKFDWPISDMVYQHHERLDGSGYPQGLKNGAISLEARIIAVADIVEAMTSHRPYRPGLGLEPALAQIESEAGTKLDQEIVNHCLKLFREKGFNWDNAPVTKLPNSGGSPAP